MGKSVEFVTWSWILLCAMNLSCGMSHFSMNVYENVSYHASCHFSILPHIWRTGFHTRTLHALQRSASVVSIIHVYIITIATCHSHETLHGCQKQQFWFASQVITSLILHIAKTVSKIKKTTNRCAKICAFRRCRAPASLHRLPWCFHWRRDQVSRDGNDRPRLIAKMASAETPAESERGMTIFLDVSYILYYRHIFSSSQ